MNNKKVITSLLVLASLAFLFYKIITGLGSFNEFNWKLNFLDLLLPLILLCSLFLLNAISWHIITLAAGIKIEPKKNIRIWLYSNLGRFLPGGIWQYPTRAYMLKKQGIPIASTFSAIFIEFLLNISAGALLVFIFYNSLELDNSPFRFRLLLIIISVSPIIFLTLSNKLSFLDPLLSKITKGKVKIESLNFNFLWFFPLVFLYILQFFIAGGALYLLLKSSMNIQDISFFKVVAIETFSWLIGYLTLVAPGGVGVQEVSIAQLLSGDLPFSVGAALAIGFRIMLLISELIVLFLAYIFLRKA